MMMHHVIGVCLPSQSAPEKHNQEKSPQTFAHCFKFSKKNFYLNYPQINKVRKSHHMQLQRYGVSVVYNKRTELDIAAALSRAY